MFFQKKIYIYKIIKNLDPNKAHGHDMISIRMIKLCGISICKPLEIIFQNCLRSGKFPSEWKKANVVPTFKKGDKQCIKNYRPVSLLPVCGKVFERLLYNKMFSFFSENDLISPKQSGFRPGDSCTNQLLSIAHEILSAFDDGHEVRGVFLDISKAFDRVWHEGLLFKLQQYGISGELITLIKDFLSCRKRRVVLNGQHSSWADVKAGVPQGSILGPLLFLIYINDLPNGLNSNVKLFADDTSLFSVVHNITDPANLLNSDLSKINEWALQWKMSFNPDPIKQAQEIIFSRKTSKRNHPGLTFNNNIVNLTTKHKHLGMIFDSKLSFDEHLKSALKKISKTVGLLRKFQGILPRASLITIYKSFARPHLDYGDIIYDQTFNESFHQRIESIQYNAAIAMTGAIRGTSSEKLYQELGLESLRSRRWLRKLCLFYKIYKNKSPSYLYDLVPDRVKFYSTRSSQIDNISNIKTRSNFFRNSFFPSTITEWNKLDCDIRNSDSLNIFKLSLLKFVRPVANSVFDINNPYGLKLLIRLRLGLSHLRYHKFKHNFQDCINPMCDCGLETEITTHFLLHCPLFQSARQSLLMNIKKTDESILKKHDELITKTLLYGDDKFDFSCNKSIISSTIEFIVSTGRFSNSLV